MLHTKQHFEHKKICPPPKLPRMLILRGIPSSSIALLANMRLCLCVRMSSLGLRLRHRLSLDTCGILDEHRLCMWRIPRLLSNEWLSWLLDYNLSRLRLLLLDLRLWWMVRMRVSMRVREVELRWRHRSWRRRWTICRAGSRREIGMGQCFCSRNPLARIKLEQAFEKVDRCQCQVNQGAFHSEQKTHPEAML